VSAGRLDGKVALITGAARGIGGACARRFVGEGATVVVADVLDEEGRALAAELGARGDFRTLDGGPRSKAITSAAGVVAARGMHTHLWPVRQSEATSTRPRVSSVRCDRVGVGLDVGEHAAGVPAGERPNEP
jgi:NAD(P)-dependent dehydrogenase (short-subunit alcohol dehydrogenase family)